MGIQLLIQEFRDLYKVDGEIKSFFAPGRVNLIGGHIDYSGGHVFPCALSLGTFAIALKRNDASIRLYSMNFKEVGVISIDLHNLQYNEKHAWANYSKGVIKTFIDAGYNIESGMDILYYGDIPNGAGLSSSASIEMVTSLALKSLYQLDISMIEMVHLSLLAENEYIGVNCGIMDQFAIGMGKANHGILLDTKTLQYSYAPIKLEDISIVIVNTNKSRDLTYSKYNERRKECERALKAIQKEVAISSLGELTINMFEKYKKLIENDVERKRAKHVVYENERTINAVGFLKEGDIISFGKLLNASHKSLKDDYNVSCFELNILVESALRHGAIGSRMTGAGFGGCTVNLVHKNKIKIFIQEVGSEYRDKTNYKADFYIATIGDGARKL